MCPNTSGKKSNKNSAEGYVVPKVTKSVNHEIYVTVKYGYCCLSCYSYMQAYTKYHHCSLYSSWEMNLNIRIKVRVDTNVDGLMDEQTNRWMENQIPI